MAATIQVVELDGRVLERGFWLYVWEVSDPDGQKLLYVGRTGDSSSPNAQSPFVRMGQHLGFLENSNMLRSHLDRHDVVPEECTFREVAYGPVMDEAADMDGHKVRRDLMAAMEKQLAEDLAGAGYLVMNVVRCRKPLDPELYSAVRTAFASEFPALADAEQA